MSSNLLAATSNQPKVLVSQRVAATETTIYSGPPESSVVIATASLCNTSSADQTVSLSVVKVGQTAGASNRVFTTPANDALRAGDSENIEQLVGVMLGPGDFISGIASDGAAVTITLTGAVSS